MFWIILEKGGNVIHHNAHFEALTFLLFADSP